MTNAFFNTHHHTSIHSNMSLPAPFIKAFIKSKMTSGVPNPEKLLDFYLFDFLTGFDTVDHCIFLEIVSLCHI